MKMRKTLLRTLIAVAIALAAYMLYRSASRYSIDEVMSALGSADPWRLAAAGGFAALSYLSLTAFDYLAVRYAGKPLAYRRTALASFCSLSIGHNIGVAALSSGAMRYRFYSRWGLSAVDVGKVIVFSGATVGLGLSTLGGIGLLLYPADAGTLLGMRRAAVLALSAACLAVPFIYLVLCGLWRKPLSVRGWTLDPPSRGIAIAQVAVGTVNFAFVAGCLHQLLSVYADIAYAKAASIYVIANAAGLISHVPGGLGVLEATVLHLLPGVGSLGALVLFRVIYFLLPLALGLPILAVSEYVLRPDPAARGAESGELPHQLS